MGTGNRLSHNNQSAPMPRGGFKDVPHPTLIRMVDGHSVYGGRNEATPFGDSEPINDEPADDFALDDGYSEDY